MRKRILEQIPQLWHRVGSLLSPPLCLACDEFLPQTESICANCRAQLRPLESGACTVCALPPGGTSLSEHRCSECLMDPPHFDHTSAAFRFGGAIQTLLHRAKFGRHLPALDALAALGAERFRSQVRRFEPDWILPMPLHWSRRWKRGFNQSHVLAEALLRAANLRIPISRMAQRKFSEPQAQKNRGERLKNLRHSFSLRSPEIYRDKKILIVDDVMTTGATAESLALALKSVKVREIEVFVLARVARNISPLMMMKEML